MTDILLEVLKEGAKDTLAREVPQVARTIIDGVRSQLSAPSLGSEKLSSRTLYASSSGQVADTMEKVASAVSTAQSNYSGGPEVFALQRKRAPVTFGPYGTGQHVKNFKRVKTVFEGNPMYRTDLLIANRYKKIPFMPFNKHAIFQELFPNGIMQAQPTDVIAWSNRISKTDHARGQYYGFLRPTARYPNMESATAYGTQVYPEVTSVTPDIKDWDAANLEVPRVYIKDLCLRLLVSGGSLGERTCRLIVLEILDDFDRQREANFVSSAPTSSATLRHYEVSQFFVNPFNSNMSIDTYNDNLPINARMRATPSYYLFNGVATGADDYKVDNYDAHMIRFKVLADQLFVLRKDEAGVNQHDIPLELKYTPGSVEFQPEHKYTGSETVSTDPTMYAMKGAGRIIWGLFQEDTMELVKDPTGVDLPTSWNGTTTATSLGTEQPSYYGNLKMLWRVVNPK